jgi:hypothetical protein
VWGASQIRGGKWVGCTLSRQFERIISRGVTGRSIGEESVQPIAQEGQGQGGIGRAMV